MASAQRNASWQRWIVGAVAVALTGVLGACTGILPMAVQTDYDRAARFGGYATFAFMAEDQRPLKRLERLDDAIDKLVTKRLHRAISDNLASKGFRQVKRGHANLLVSLHMGIKRPVDVTDLPYRQPHDWQYSTQVSHYDRGTLIIDLVDRRKHQLVWRGTAGSVWSGGNPASREQLELAVKEILNKFPPHLQ